MVVLRILWKREERKNENVQITSVMNAISTIYWKTYASHELNLYVAREYFRDIIPNDLKTYKT